MREIKFEIMFLIHGADFESRIAKHYTTLDRLTDGRDTFDYKDAEIVAKRQFTGLKDKNGVDIYEGDIVKQSYDYDEDDFQIFSVVFSNDCYSKTMGFHCISPTGERWSFYGGMPDSDEMSVIGNIHENADLLK